MLGVERLRCVLGRGGRRRCRATTGRGPSVHGHVDPGAAHHQHVLHGSPWPSTASSTASFSDTAFAAAILPVGGDHQLGLGVFDACRSAVAENPANTTVCINPSRAQASIATIASGTIGM